MVNHFPFQRNDTRSSVLKEPIKPFQRQVCECRVGVAVSMGMSGARTGWCHSGVASECTSLGVSVIVEHE